MISVRCSSLDRILSCAGSIKEPDHPYRPHNPEAAEGQAGHKALHSLALGQAPDLTAIADEYQVDVDELQKLYEKGQVIWEQLIECGWLAGDRYPEEAMQSELPGGILLTGHTDLAVVRGNEWLAVLDWKLGFKPSEHPNQIRGYARLARDRWGMPATGYVYGIEVWVRLGEAITHKFTDHQLDLLTVELQEQVRLGPKQYGPGFDACRYCPRQNACEALNEWRRGSVSALAPVSQNQPITRELVGSLFERKKQLDAALRQYDKVLESMLAEGPVPMGDGRYITQQAQEVDVIRPSEALEFFERVLEMQPHELDEAVSISKTALGRVVKARVAKGQGAAAERRVITALRAKGAIRKGIRQQKRIVASLPDTSTQGKAQ